MSNQLTVTESNNVLIVSGVGPQGPAGTGPGGSISDGDKGDITVSGSGATWTIDANAISTAKIADDAVTFAKLQNITGPTILGRQNAAAGSVEQIGLAAAFTINGSKQLDLANALAVASTTLTAGTGLTGGGDLSANRTFAVAYGTTSGTACQGNDARLSDARTPTAHTHALADIQQGGATSGQVIEWNGTAWAPASITGGGGGTVTSVTAGDGLLGGTITASGTIDVNFGNTGNTVCEGNDQRLSDARTPTAHNHAATEITSGTLDIARIPTGTSSTTVCIGNDARLSDARTPTAHTHALADLTQSSATNGQVPTWNGSAWAPATPSGGGTDPLDADVVAWHAITQHPRWSSTVIGTGAAVGATDSDSAAGVWRVEVGAQAVANRRASYTGGSHRFDAVTSSEFVASCSMSTNFSGTNTGWAAVGWIDSNANSASESTDGAFFRATDGGNWYAVTRSNGSETATDSGTASSSSFVRLRVVVSEISSTWTAKFYLGGSLVATHTTNVPTGSGRHTGQGIMLNRTAATAVSCALDVDYVYTRIDYASSMVVS